MRKDKLSLKTMAILIVVLIVLSAVLAYLVLRKPEEPEYTPGAPPVFSARALTYNDEYNIVTWQVIWGYDFLLTKLNIALFVNHTQIPLNLKKVSLTEFTDQYLTNDPNYQVYYYENETSLGQIGMVDGGDLFKVKAPLDGVYRVWGKYEHYGIVWESNFTHF